MIIPSIDLQGGMAVQLVGGKGEPVEIRNPYIMAEKFSIMPEVAIIDLDAALGTEDNRDLIHKIIRTHPTVGFRVGGGLRTHEAVTDMLKAGAAKVIIGTAATPEFLKPLSAYKDRIQVALDVRDQVVQSHGWQQSTGHDLTTRIVELENYVGSFLVTFIDHEGQMQGTDVPTAEVLSISGCDITVAGGIAAINTIAMLSAFGLDIQMGMAIYTDKVLLGDAVAASAKFDRQGLSLRVDEAQHRHLLVSLTERAVGQGQDIRQHPRGSAGGPRLRPGHHLGDGQAAW